MSEIDAHRFWEHDIKIDKVTWLYGAIHGFDDDDFFEDVILDAGAPYMHPTMKPFSDLPDWAQTEDGFIDWLLGGKLQGFIVKVVTPKPTKFHKDGGYTSLSFGYSASTYIYVDAPEDAIPLSVEWQADRMKVWREEQEKAA